MFLHPSNILFLSLLTLTIVMILSAESWLMIWLFLEINLLLFIPLVFKKKSKYQSEASLKYFINQAMSSVLILSAATFLPYSHYIISPALYTAFVLKMGVAPLHGWLISVSSAISWFSLWLLLIVQKIAPMLILNTITNYCTFTLVFTVIATTSLVGALGGLTTPSMKKIMTYSSIAQMGWLLTAIWVSSQSWILYFTIYSMVTSIILLSLYFTKSNKLNDLLTTSNKNMKTIMIMNMLAIAGLPPFSGFMMKLMLIMKILDTSKSVLLLPLIVSSLVSLFFYSRIFYMNTMNHSSTKKNNTTPRLEKLFVLINMLALPLGLLVFI